jgi:hypothetical protein
MTQEEIQARYVKICTILGDVEVKLKGLQNQRAAIFAQLEELDREAEKLNEVKNTESV